MRCSENFAAADLDPVLLMHGTALDSESNFAWNWIPAFVAGSRPFCRGDFPEDGLADIQNSAEYVVFALRTRHARRPQRIDIVGDSQGGMLPHWVLR